MSLGEVAVVAEFVVVGVKTPVVVTAAVRWPVSTMDGFGAVLTPVLDAPATIPVRPNPSRGETVAATTLPGVVSVVVGVGVAGVAAVSVTPLDEVVSEVASERVGMVVAPARNAAPDTDAAPSPTISVTTPAAEAACVVTVVDEAAGSTVVSVVVGVEAASSVVSPTALLDTVTLVVTVIPPVEPVETTASSGVASPAEDVTVAVWSVPATASLAVTETPADCPSAV